MVKIMITRRELLDDVDGSSFVYQMLCDSFNEAKKIIFNEIKNFNEGCDEVKTLEEIAVLMKDWGFDVVYEDGEIDDFIFSWEDNCKGSIYTLSFFNADNKSWQYVMTL